MKSFSAMIRLPAVSGGNPTFVRAADVNVVTKLPMQDGSDVTVVFLKHRDDPIATGMTLSGVVQLVSAAELEAILAREMASKEAQG